MQIKHAALWSAFTLFFCSLYFSPAISAQVYTTNFNTNALGWVFSPTSSSQAWKWNASTGVDNLGGLTVNVAPVAMTHFTASPAMQLTAGVEYKVRFKSKAALINARTLTLASNSTPNRTGSTILFTSPNLKINFQSYEATFTAATNSTIHLILYANRVGNANNTLYTAVSLDDFTVEKVVTVPNQIPIVDIVNPGTVFNLNSSITINSYAQDLDGSIIKVEFYLDNIKVGEDLTFPYNYTIILNTPGYHTIRTKAIDNLGAVGVSLNLAEFNVLNTSALIYLNAYTNTQEMIEGELTHISVNYLGTISLDSIVLFNGTSNIGKVSNITMIKDFVIKSGLNKLTAKGYFGNNITNSNTMNYTGIPYTTGINSLGVWNFNDDIQGWSSFGLTDIHQFRRQIGSGTNFTAGLFLPTPSALNYIASPKISFESNKIYTIKFDAQITNQLLSPGIVHVGYSKEISRNVDYTEIGTFTVNKLTPNSFSQFNKSFQTSVTEKFYLIFYVESNSTLNFTLDNVSLEKSIAPAISFVLPNENVFSDGQTVNLKVNASDLDGTIAKVEFLDNDDYVIKTISQAPYEFAWQNMLPGHYYVKARATDNSGNVKTVERNKFEVRYADGTLSNYVDFQFNNTKEYWWKQNGDWRWKDSGGDNNSGFLSGFSLENGNFIATHGMELKAETTYKLQFKLDATTTNSTINFSINNAQKSGGQLITSVTPTTSEDFLQNREVSFTVPATGLYYLVLSHPWSEGSFQQIKIDKVRVRGNLNAAPVTRITQPNVLSSNLSAVVGSEIAFEAEAKDYWGSIAKVEYYANNVLIGQSSTAPYKFVWSNFVAGNYKIYTKAYDNLGLSDSSKTIIVNILDNHYNIATLLGNCLTSNDVIGSAIQSNGNIVLAANIDFSYYSNLPNNFLNNSTASTKGTIIRLSPDGQTVLSVTKLATKINNISVDKRSKIYVSADSEGIFKLNETASQVIWQKTTPKPAHRIDVSKSGYSVVLTANSNVNILTNLLTQAVIYVLDPNGNLLSQLPEASTFTNDVAIDEESRTVISVGYKTANTAAIAGGISKPIHIPVMRGYDFEGNIKYVGYDWSEDQNSNRWINKYNNNMSSGKLTRCAIGKDGKLYLTHEVYGTNNCERFSPYDLSSPVSVVGGDSYFNFNNTASANNAKLFVSRHDIATGNYLKGQEFTTRIPSALPSYYDYVLTENGEITADSMGNVYIVGTSGPGLPLTLNHLTTTNYEGGAFLLILSQDLSTRKECIRFAIGQGKTVATSNENQHVFGGNTNLSMYTVNAYPMCTQMSPFWYNKGWFGVYNVETAPRQQATGREFIAIEDGQLSMEIYPNPSESGQLKVYLQGLLDKIYQLQMVNLSGQIVYTTQGQGDAELQLSDWKTNAGTYILHLTTDAGVVSKKVVIF
jgi:hypothetical protein